MELDKGQRRGGPAQITHVTPPPRVSNRRILWRTINNINDARHKESDEVGCEKREGFFVVGMWVKMGDYCLGIISGGEVCERIKVFIVFRKGGLW